MKNYSLISADHALKLLLPPLAKTRVTIGKKYGLAHRQPMGKINGRSIKEQASQQDVWQSVETNSLVRDISAVLSSRKQLRH